jgi:predicted glycoside hydrolase/deacetylase ChbG (UPF0249 family)
LSGDRFLVVNADDLGLSDAVNAGIRAAHTDGVVTSASLMVDQAAAAAAATMSAGLPRLAVGLHLDLGEWNYVAGEWQRAYQRCDTGDAVAVEAECRAQLERFRALTGHDPTHLDSHQHVHDSEPVAGVARRLAAELEVPLRGVSIRYEGGFYGQDGKGVPFPGSIEPRSLVRLVEELAAGWTEIGCHPAAGPVPSSYDAERQVELRTLCDPRVRAAIEAAGVGLRSFGQISQPSP